MGVAGLASESRQTTASPIRDDFRALSGLFSGLSPKKINEFQKRCLRRRQCRQRFEWSQ